MRDWLGSLEGTDDPIEALSDLKAILKSIADAFMTDFIQIKKPGLCLVSDCRQIPNFEIL